MGYLFHVMPLSYVLLLCAVPLLLLNTAHLITPPPLHMLLLYLMYATLQGSYRACNRIGIESSVSPFLKMSFETAAHFLTEATLKASVDDMRTPSARLCMGQ
eukprot:scaffold160466_cov30-Tisochrysis_lutea.AAC.1